MSLVSCFICSDVVRFVYIVVCSSLFLFIAELGYHSCVSSYLLMNSWVVSSLGLLQIKLPCEFPGGPVTKTLGLIPGQGTRFHMLQLRPGTAKWINKYLLKKEKKHHEHLYTSLCVDLCLNGSPNLPLGSNAWWSEVGLMCNNNRNKVHNKCSALESFQKHLAAPLSVEKLSSTKLVPAARKVGDHWYRRYMHESSQF